MPESPSLAPEVESTEHVHGQTVRPPSRVPSWLIPSLVDIFFVVLVMAAFGRPGGWQSLLADGDTGWHIRTGELIWRSGHVPVADPYSFSRAGEPWIAWEWLADLLFAGMYGWRGLGGVAAAAGVAICLAAAALFGWLLRRGAGLAIGLVVTLAVVSASSIHYLARPHVFSILIYTLALWVLDEDRRRACWWLWLLVPLTALWANLHAGFVSLPATLGLLAAVCLARRQWRSGRRYGILGLLSAGAALANPYGWRLYSHILSYLRSSWILNFVQEFKSPSIRSEETVIFAVLLLVGALMASRAFGRGEWFEGALAMLWGLAAMRSARHIPFYMLTAAPLLASEFARISCGWAERSPSRSTWRLAWDLSQDLGRWSHGSLWLALAAGVTLSTAGTGAAFPDQYFPARALELNSGLFKGSTAARRIMTSDQWGDYLIFRLYPSQRVFIDGRSDFYGPVLGSEYRSLQNASAGWRDALERHRFDAALLPRDWALGGLLEREPGWNKVYQDPVAVLFTRKGESRP